ncbi:C40 family peptidase [Lacticaseibacillus porcinae]|uniref:C40 family peptidase n=1 Tax=Lacticaseibacillus porcinae TaxID=1123687 RepID=UPI000F76FBD8|nr:C40 family peptidase [Lacticaseibacillus porcinae]
MTSIKTVTAIAFATILTTIGVGAHTVNAAESTASLQAQLQQAQNSVAKLNEQASAKAVEIQNAQANIKDATAKINTYEVKITKAQAELTKRTANMKAQLRSLQKEAGNSVTGNVYFDFILNAKNLDDAVSRSFTVGKLNEANQQALADVQSANKDLADAKQQAVDNKATLVANEAKLEKDRDSLKTLSAQASAKQADLQKKINDNQAAYKALQGDVAKANTQAKAAATPVQASKSAIQAATVTAKAAQPATNAGTGHLSGIAGIAQRYIGVPYVWGGASPSGFDCSGLVMYAASQIGVSLPHSSETQSTMGTSVSMSALQTGDLLFWGGVGSAYHVAIYIGGGRYIHAPQPGQNVTVQSISAWSPSFARRL